MDGWMDEKKEGWMDGWMGGQMGGHVTDEWTDELMDGQEQTDLDVPILRAYIHF